MATKDPIILYTLLARYAEKKPPKKDPMEKVPG